MSILTFDHLSEKFKNFIAKQVLTADQGFKTSVWQSFTKGLKADLTDLIK